MAERKATDDDESLVRLLREADEVLIIDSSEGRLDTGFFGYRPRGREKSGDKSVAERDVAETLLCHLLPDVSPNLESMPEGQDPPDVIVTTPDGRRVGIEVTMLHELGKTNNCRRLSSLPQSCALTVIRQRADRSIAEKIRKQHARTHDLRKAPLVTFSELWLVIWIDEVDIAPFDFEGMSTELDILSPFGRVFCLFTYQGKTSEQAPLRDTYPLFELHIGRGWVRYN